MLVNSVGLYLEDTPIAELFGRPPNELAEMLFADQSHPIAQAMHSMAEFAGDVGVKMEIPLEASSSRCGRRWVRPHASDGIRTCTTRRRGRLRRVACPVLVVAGEHDGLVPVEHARTFAAEPDAHLEVMADAAHWLQMERPADSPPSRAASSHRKRRAHRGVRTTECRDGHWWETMHPGWTTTPEPPNVARTPRSSSRGLTTPTRSESSTTGGSRVHDLAFRVTGESSRRGGRRAGQRSCRLGTTCPRLQDPAAFGGWLLRITQRGARPSPP